MSATHILVVVGDLDESVRSIYKMHDKNTNLHATQTLLLLISFLMIIWHEDNYPFPFFLPYICALLIGCKRRSPFPNHQFRSDRYMARGQLSTSMKIKMHFANVANNAFFSCD